MQIEIIKEPLKKYKAGDILSVGNPHEIDHYLLYENNTEGLIGLIDLNDGSVYKEIINKGSFDPLISEIIDNKDVHEYKVFNSGSEVKLILGK